MSSDKNPIKAKLLQLKDSTTVAVRPHEVDFMRVVHFMNYLVYFDEGFVSFMNLILKNIMDVANKGTVFPVKRVDITYEDSARLGDKVIIETNMKKVGKTSMSFSHVLYRESDKTLLAKAECVRLIMDLETKKLLTVEDFFSHYVKS